jgi:hypothetical protein
MPVCLTLDARMYGRILCLTAGGALLASLRIYTIVDRFVERG